jgi:Xaa-Pro aminopeptidase
VNAFVKTFRLNSKNPRPKLGYGVGMSTCDVFQDYVPFRRGMVFHDRAAFQVKEEQINIRCEDLIVVTERGAEMSF